MSEAMRKVLKKAGEEAKFQAWYKEKAKRLGLHPDPDHPKQQYDYRGAYKAGAKVDESGHWPSEFKHKDHPRRVIDGVDTATGKRVK